MFKLRFKNINNARNMKGSFIFHIKTLLAMKRY